MSIDANLDPKKKKKSCQQPERQVKQTTGELRVHSTSYDKGSCFAMA